MTTPDADTFALKTAAWSEVDAPDLPWQPPRRAATAPGSGSSVLAATYRPTSTPVAARAGRWPNSATAVWHSGLVKAEAAATEFAPTVRVTDRYQTS